MKMTHLSSEQLSTLEALVRAELQSVEEGMYPPDQERHYKPHLQRLLRKIERTA